MPSGTRLSIGYNNLGNALLQLGRRQEALDCYLKSVTIRERLAAADPKNAEAQRDLNSGYGKLVALVLADVSFARNLPAARQVPTLVVALAILLTKNDPPKARQAAELLAELAKDADNYYSAARGFRAPERKRGQGGPGEGCQACGRAVSASRRQGLQECRFHQAVPGPRLPPRSRRFQALLADLEKANPPKQ